jgi:hypothetical protein
MKSVLGVDTVVFDGVIAPGANVSSDPIRISEIPAHPKLIVLVATAENRLPLDSSSQDLLGKMIQAMKLDPAHMIFIEWGGVAQTAFLIDEVLNRFASVPALAFGEVAATALSAAARGEILSLGSRKVLSTHSLEMLLRKPELKKETWTHLQKLMKIVG